VEVPVGQSAVSFRGSVLLIMLLNVRVDGQLVTPLDALGDGSVETPSSRRACIPAD
jgi:hypothetical protein